MSESLRSSLSATGLLVTVYALVVVVASAPLTYLTRRVSRRFLLSGLLGVFVAGTLAAAAAPGYGWLLAARVVAALSQAVFWSIAAVTAAGLFPADERGRAIAPIPMRLDTDCWSPQRSWLSLVRSPPIPTSAHFSPTSADFPRRTFHRCWPSPALPRWPRSAASAAGLRTTALAGGLLASAALAVILSEPHVGTAIRRIRPGN